MGHQGRGTRNATLLLLVAWIGLAAWIATREGPVRTLVLPPFREDVAPGSPPRSVEPLAVSGSRLVVCTEAGVHGPPTDETSAVDISGTLEFKGRLVGEILIEVCAPGSSTVIHHLVCPGLGRFNARLPRDLGKVVLLAVMDGDLDGPSLEDPAATTRSIIDTTAGPVSGLFFKLEEGATPSSCGVLE